METATRGMARYLAEVRRAGLYSDVLVVAGGPGWKCRVAAHRVIIAQSDFFRARLRWDCDEPICVWIDDAAATREAFEDVMNWLYCGSFDLGDEDAWVSRIAVARFLGAHAAVDVCCAMLLRAETALDGLGRALTARDVARYYMLPDLETAALWSMRASLALAVATLDVRVPALLRRIDIQDMSLLLNDAWFATDADREAVADLWALANQRSIGSFLNCNEDRLGFAFDISSLPMDAHVDGHTLRLVCDGGGTVVTASLIVRSLHQCASTFHVSLRCFHARGATVFIDTFAFTPLDDHRCVSTPVKCFDLHDLPKYAHCDKLLIALTILDRPIGGYEAERFFRRQSVGDPTTTLASSSLEESRCACCCTQQQLQQQEEDTASSSSTGRRQQPKTFVDGTRRPILAAS